MNIIDELMSKQTEELKKIIEHAFFKHFGFSIYDIDMREIEHIMIEGCPIESYRYRGETFLYVKDNPGDVILDKDNCGVRVVYTMEYMEV